MGADVYARVGHLPQEGIQDRTIAPVLDGIHPDQDDIDRQQLSANLLSEIIVVHGRLGVDAPVGQGMKNGGQPVVVRLGIFSGLPVARVKGWPPFRF
jgi:hypothetical protein